MPCHTCFFQVLLDSVADDKNKDPGFYIWPNGEKIIIHRAHKDMKNPLAQFSMAGVASEQFLRWGLWWLCFDACVIGLLGTFLSFFQCGFLNLSFFNCATLYLRRYSESAESCLPALAGVPLAAERIIAGLRAHGRRCDPDFHIAFMRPCAWLECAASDEWQDSPNCVLSLMC